MFLKFLQEKRKDPVRLNPFQITQELIYTANQAWLRRLEWIQKQKPNFIHGSKL